MIDSKSRNLCFEIRSKYSELHLLICKYLTDLNPELPRLISLKQIELKTLEEQFHATLMVGVSA